MDIKDRPTDMIHRQLAANRSAARCYDTENNRRHFAHLLPYRPYFVIEMLAMRKELINRRSYIHGMGKG
jgi:hypothetical protein